MEEKRQLQKGGCPLRKNNVLKIMNEKISLDACIESLLQQVFNLTHLLILRIRVENDFLAFWCNVYLASRDDASKLVSR